MEDTPTSTGETFAGFLEIKAAGVEAVSTNGPTQKVGLSGIVAVLLKVTVRYVSTIGGINSSFTDSVMVTA